MTSASISVTAIAPSFCGSCRDIGSVESCSSAKAFGANFNCSRVFTATKISKKAVRKTPECLLFQLDGFNQNSAKDQFRDVTGCRIEKKSTINFLSYNEISGLQRYRERHLIHGRRAMPSIVGALSVESVTGVTSQNAGQKTQYHFVVANAKFMLDEEEHFQELMRERLRYFGEQNKEQDFWLVFEPEFLASFPGFTKRLGRPAVALVSTDATWITFMKLRLDRVLKGAFEADTAAEALAGGNSSTGLNFEKSGVWTAPYAKYEGPWWTPFLPPQKIV